MTHQSKRNDLKALDALEKKVAAIRNALKAVAKLDGVTNALAIVDQLDEAITDIAADIEMELHECNAQKGR